ncbi:uromodulin-like 1 [Melanotaenia boesemani]|uniref:uromodulin-like 1 n=1 Tax=Melanotaenia boesemani TaxID=1250792 RepID=UPI001C03B146|nr:uromodulin-like 1 [Melanotaenia boesemani]
MNSVEYSLLLFILVPHSFGRCFDMSFSICWVGTEQFLERQNGNLWLNDTSLKTVMKAGRMTSLTVSPVVENKLALQNGDSILRWTFTISPRTKVIKITGRQEPLEHPTNATKGFMAVLSPSEVFACESGTTFLLQDENFFLAVGHTLLFPVKLESRSPSMLLVSWVEKYSDVINIHNMSLYHIEMGSYNIFSVDTTSLNHHRFSALEPCSHYVVCVEIADTHSLTCLSTITDPDVPQDFVVTSWNSSSISLAWNCPSNLKYSLFLLTVFYLNGTDHVTEEVELWLTDDSLAFRLSDLQPCTRVKFGLQTVCQAGLESRHSKMILTDGNSLYSNIHSLQQTLYGPSNYTLSWEVGNTSSVSMFRVYHAGVLQGSTLLTNYTVIGLLPCQTHQAKVEALCGENVLMDAKTVTAHTGPNGVSNLRYRPDDSTILWTPSIPQQPAVAFIYELSLENGSTIQSSRVSNTQLHLPGLEEGKSYLLEVWEECDGKWESEPSQFSFEGGNSSFEFSVRAFESDLQLEVDFDNMGLTMVVPWSMPKDLQDSSSESRAKMEQIVKDKLQELLKDFDQPARIEVDSFEPAEEPGKTEVLFQSFDASITGEKVLLPVNDQLNYIDSLNSPNITVKKGVIYWDGPDLCTSSKQPLCPHNSLCINTLGWYSCVCQVGYYDVSSIMDPPAASRPHCKDKGLFSQCLEKVMTGAIAKAYLTAHFEGKVEVKLNDGRCNVNESEGLYYFHTSRKSSECGTEKQVNKTHIMLHNILAVSLTKEETISRRDLKVVWRCIYPRHYARNAQVIADMKWVSSIFLVEFNSSLLLGLTMTLYKDESYTHSYSQKVDLGFEDTLFFQVALQTNSSFVSDVLLQVESCWATESIDPHDPIKALLLEEGCPADNTFHWLSVNGLEQRSRFSIQMFMMPKGLPLFFHCLANICEHDEDCTKNCSNQQRSKRSANQMDGHGKRAAVVSAGPLVVNMRVKSVQPSSWSEHMTMVFIVAASISFLGVTVLLLSATKAIMMYYEQLRLQ